MRDPIFVRTARAVVVITCLALAAGCCGDFGHSNVCTPRLLVARTQRPAPQHLLAATPVAGQRGVR